MTEFMYNFYEISKIGKIIDYQKLKKEEIKRQLYKRKRISF